MEEEESGPRKNFIESKGLTTTEADQLLLQWGPNELEEKKKAKVTFLYINYKRTLVNIYVFLYKFIFV